MLVVNKGKRGGHALINKNKRPEKIRPYKNERAKAGAALRKQKGTQIRE